MNTLFAPWRQAATALGFDLGLYTDPYQRYGGHLQWQAFRADIRRFHNAVLDQGALPLATLERVVDDWVQAQLKL